MFPTMTATSRLTSILIRVGLLCAVGRSLYFLGSSPGKQVEKAKWDNQPAPQQTAINNLRIDYARKQSVHQQAVTALENELDKGKQHYEKALADLDARYTQRLRIAEQRAIVYQRQATGSPADARDLASNAARLAASLEEGRQLVEEFRTTLGLREDQLRRLGALIQADRQLFTEPTE